MEDDSGRPWLSLLGLSFFVCLVDRMVPDGLVASGIPDFHKQILVFIRKGKDF